MNILLAAVVLALLTVAISLGFVRRAVVLHMNRPTPPEPDRVTTNDLAMMNSRFHAEVESLRFAIAEGIERTDRAEKRVQKTIAGSRRLLRESGLEDPKLEAEASQLHERDEDRSPRRELPPVPKGVAQARRIRIPGGSLEIGAA